MTVNCRLCGSEVDPKHGPLRLGLNGLPVAATVDAEIALPLIEPCSGANWKISLDGVDQDGVIAFDCEAGRLWRHQCDATGRLMLRNDSFMVEQVAGIVTVEAKSANDGSLAA